MVQHQTKLETVTPEYFLLVTLKKLRLVGSQWDGPGPASGCFVLSYFFRFFTSIPLANYSVHPTPPLGGPRSRKHCWGRDGPIERWSRTPGSQRGGGRGGARRGGLGVAIEKWSRIPTLYTTTRQSNIVGPFTPPPLPERPGARVVEGAGPSQLFYMGVLLPKVGVG